MPQLMPMSWIFSSFVVLIIFGVMILLFSSSCEQVQMPFVVLGGDINKVYWCW